MSSQCKISSVSSRTGNSTAKIESSNAKLQTTIENSKAKLENEIAASEVKLQENLAKIDTNIGKLAQKKVAIESNKAKIGEQEAERNDTFEKVTDLLLKAAAF